MRTVTEKFQLIELDGRDERIVDEYDSEIECIQRINKVPVDLMSDPIFTIRKVYYSKNY